MLKKIEEYRKLETHRKARLTQHGQVLDKTIARDYEEIINSPEAREAREYLAFTPNTTQERIEHLKNLKGFNEFYSELNKKLKNMSHDDSQRIKNSILSSYFPKENNGSQLRYLPEVSDLDRIITETKNTFRQPLVDSDGRYSVSPENLILVHKTDYLPEQQKIKTTGNSTITRQEYASEKFLPTRAARQTVHFSLNHPVRSHTSGNWDNKKYAVLVPAENVVQDNLVTINPSDTYGFGNVYLTGKGAEVIVSREAYHKMSQKELNRLKKRTGAEIITIANKDESLDNAINRRISERGYTSLDSNQHGNIIINDGDRLTDAVNRMALDRGKSIMSHTNSPFHALEYHTSSIEHGKSTVSTAGYGYGNPDYEGDVLIGSRRALADARRDLIKARGGEQNLTREDKRTLEKLEKVVDNYKYAPTKSKKE